MWAKVIFCQIPRCESLHKNKSCTDNSQEQLDVTKASDHQTRNPDTIPTVDHHNQIGNHVDQSPGHTDHVHVVEIKLHIGGNNGCFGKNGG